MARFIKSIAGILHRRTTKKVYKLSKVVMVGDNVGGKRRGAKQHQTRAISSSKVGSAQAQRGNGGGGNRTSSSAAAASQGSHRSSAEAPIPRPQDWNATNFLKQAQEMLALPVPLLLDQEAIKSDTLISCGGSHVFRFHSYNELEKIRHLGDVLPEHEPFMAGRSGKLFDKCAVVGNSGSLLETQLGPDIDSHDIVFRFNAGITSGYEQFVGSKTTFRLLNNPDVTVKEAGEVYLHTLRNHDLKNWAAALSVDEERQKSCFVCDPEFLCYSWQWVRNQGHKPSSGLVGVILAMKVCEKLNVYGFQFRNYFSKTSRPHYYDWERPKKGREGVHPFMREVALYRNLQEVGLANFVESESAESSDVRHRR